MQQKNISAPVSLAFYQFHYTCYSGIFIFFVPQPAILMHKNIPFRAIFEKPEFAAISPFITFGA